MNLTVTQWCWAEFELFVDQHLGVNKVLNPTALPNVNHRDGNSKTFRHTFTLLTTTTILPMMGIPNVWKVWGILPCESYSYWLVLQELELLKRSVSLVELAVREGFLRNHKKIER